MKTWLIIGVGSVKGSEENGCSLEGGCELKGLLALVHKCRGFPQAPAAKLNGPPLFGATLESFTYFQEIGGK